MFDWLSRIFRQRPARAAIPLATSPITRRRAHPLLATVTLRSPTTRCWRYVANSTGDRIRNRRIDSRGPIVRITSSGAVSSVNADTSRQRQDTGLETNRSLRGSRATLVQRSASRVSPSSRSTRLGPAPSRSSRAERGLSAGYGDTERNDRNDDTASHSQGSNDDLRTRLLDKRDEIRDAYAKYDRSREYFDLYRLQHINGIQTEGMKDWSPTWTLQEWENAYLRRSRSLISGIRWIEGVYDATLDMVRDRSLTVSIQESGFADRRDDGYTSAEEAKYRAGAPRYRITNWLNMMPPEWVDYTQAEQDVEPVRDPPPDNRGGFEDLASVDIGDSVSCSAWGRDKGRIDRWRSALDSHAAPGDGPDF